MPDITIYTSKTCGPCRTVKAYLQRKGLEFLEKSVDDNPDYWGDVVRLSGFNTVPVTVIGGVPVSGPNLGMLAALLTKY